MPDLTRYDMQKFFFFLGAHIMVALGTQAKDFIAAHPTMAIICASAGAFTIGFFMNNGSGGNVPPPPTVTR